MPEMISKKADSAEEMNESENTEGQQFLGLISDSLLSQYDLDEKDLKILNLLMESLLNGKDGLQPVSVLKRFGKESSAIFEVSKRLGRLRQIGILAIDSRNDDDMESLGCLLRATFKLSNEFLSKLFNESTETPSFQAEPYKDNFEYLADQFEKIKILIGIKGIDSRMRKIIGISKNRRQANEEMSRIEGRIMERLQKTDKVFPFEELKKRYRFNHKEEVIILALLHNEISDSRPFEVETLLDMVSETPYEKLSNRALFQEKGKLIKKNLIAVRRGFREEGYALNHELTAWLLGERKQWRKKKQIEKWDLFEVTKPDVSIDKVILPEKTISEIQTAMDMVNGNVSYQLQKWGVKGNMLMKDSSAPLLMLFYGPPGTGKTFAVYALAYEMKRHVLTVDCSRILDKYVGESEKNTRAIFDRYRAVSKSLRKQPVLLLNEADQFLHRRINAVRSVDHMYNQMQNIFLEQMERFDGILIATTNLIRNLDEAFSRRFQFKIEFKRPGPAERLKLWEIHIPEKTPLSEDVDLRYLSEEYDLSGGQIAVVVRNAIGMAARKRDRLSQEDLINACENETVSNFDEKGKRKIGF